MIPVSLNTASRCGYFSGKGIPPGCAVLLERLEYWRKIAIDYRTQEIMRISGWKETIWELRKHAEYMAKKELDEDAP